MVLCSSSTACFRSTRSHRAEDGRYQLLLITPVTNYSTRFIYWKILIQTMRHLLRSHSSIISTITRRTYTTPPPKPKRNLRAKGPLLGLDHFLQRKKTIALWRDIVRAINKIPPSSTRDEMRSFARGEFGRYKDVTDIGHIRYLISSGKTQFDSMRRYIDEQAG
ncbi:hypothetical protein EJ08DRAFT_352696 [Tothia fuscella]|uniref:LYR motif-containing protein 2 n=1 Tax=Tothia fuscella TaxID=1048955 RepID=A0A9P4NM98_9PEZI|nr:hypothetical protein EJ08DRAFT_352696 [Tothia fuscella]